MGFCCKWAFPTLGSAQHGHPEGWKRPFTTEPHIDFFCLAQHHRKIKLHLCSLPEYEHQGKNRISIPG